MKGLRVIGVIAFAAGLAAVLAWLIGDHDIPVLNPKGAIGSQQRDLMVIATLLMLIVVVPVFALTGFIAWRYREGNKKAKYQPNMDGSKVLETIWWGLPLAIIFTLSILIWKSSHALDPYKQLEHDKAPLTIQVVALQWKWLFLYPDQNIATVNFVQFPQDRPVNFQITADAPMNSFWIPSLGGQVYAMAGMETKLHLIADKSGDYDGSSANISGEGFAGMRFTARSSSDEEFASWVDQVKHTDKKLDTATYAELMKPSKNVASVFYGQHDPDLYNTIIMKYMSPPADKTGENHEYAH